jgi:hypothetical protein
MSQEHVIVCPRQETTLHELQSLAMDLAAVHKRLAESLNRLETVDDYTRFYQAL